MASRACVFNRAYFWGLLTVPASAAPASRSAPVAVAPSPPGSVQASRSNGSAQQPSAAAGPDIIVCTPNLQDPHESTHSGQTIVNVIGTVECTSAVTLIQIQVQLWYDGSPVSTSPTKEAAETAGPVSQNTTALCLSGTYTGWMWYWVQWPPGYTPSTGSSSGFGNSRNLCGG